MLESPFAVIARFPRTVRLLLYGTLINKIGTFILPFLTLVLARDLRLSSTWTGIVMTSYGVGSLASILTGGLLTDHLGRRRTLLLSLLGSGALAVALGFAPSPRTFIPILLVYGFLGDLYRPASTAIIGDVLPSRDRGTGFAALRMAVNLGFAAGTSLGGILVDWNWRLLFIGDGLTTLAFGVLVFLMIEETRPTVPHEEAASVESRGGPWRDTVFLQQLLTGLAFATAVFSIFTVLPLTITLSARYPASTYGVLVGVNGLLIGLFEVSLVAWFRRYRRLRVAALGTILCGIGMGATGLVLHWAWFLFVIVTWSLGEIMIAPQQMSFLSDWAPPSLRGRYMGMWGATWSLALMLNPLLLLPLHAHLSEAMFWPVILLLVFPTFLVLLRLDRTADRPELLLGHSEEVASTPLPAARPDL